MKASKKVASVAIIFSIFMNAFFAVSCTTQENTPGVITNTVTRTLTQTISPTVTLTPTPRIPTDTPTEEPTENIFFTGSNINFTQEPNEFIAEKMPDESEYIYHHAIVNLNLKDELWEERYIDLDNLSSNSPEDSDLVFNVSSGSGTFYEMWPANNAIFYASDNKSEDISTCLKHFSELHFDEFSYQIQGGWVTSGYPYCFLTNGGHIAVVYLDTQPLRKRVGNDSIVSLIVSVYKRKITTPIINTTPTVTPFYTVTMTPTNALTPLPVEEASLFSQNLGYLSGDQIVILDTAIHNFQKWVGAGKKESVASMIIFPYAYYDEDGVYAIANNKEEFLANYDKIFPESYAQELANVSLEEGLFITWRGIALMPPKIGLGVWFTDKGYIYSY